MRATAVVLSLLSLALIAAPATSALTEVTIVATEGPDCPLPEQKPLCLIVDQGELDGVPQGEAVQLTLSNQGNAPHNAYIALQADASGEAPRDNSPDIAFANTSTVDGGGETTTTFLVPSDAEGLYLWCEVGDHEALGMWLEVSVTPAETGDGNQTDDGDGQDGNGTSQPPGDDDNPREQPVDGEEGNGTPVGTWIAIAAGTLAAIAIAPARHR